MKKVSKKVTKKSVKTRVSAPVQHARPTLKAGHTHSAVFSDMTLVGLALFFVLVGLLAVMMHRRQNEEIEQWMRQRRNQSQVQQTY